jgi:hypothetical protein
MNLECRRFPPTMTLLPGPKGITATGNYPPIKRDTPACDEFKAKIAQ